MRKPIVTIAAMLIAVSACAPGSNNPKPTQKPPSAVQTDVAKAGPVTLTVWDQEVLGGQNEQMQKLNAAFHAKYPNVTIKRVSRSFSDLEKTLRLALSGDNPPDVVEANQGYGIMAALVKAGALIPLDPYDKVYGFRKRFPAGVSQLNSVTGDGKTIGSGNLYGVSMTGEAVGIYYNTDKLAKLGIQPPTSFSQFEQDLALAKSKGETPIYFANLEKFPAIHELGVLLGQTADKGALRNLVFGQGGAWTDPPVVQAVQKLADWAKNGYLPRTANAGEVQRLAVGVREGRRGVPHRRAVVRRGPAEEDGGQGPLHAPATSAGRTGPAVHAGRPRPAAGDHRQVQAPRRRRGVPELHDQPAGDGRRRPDRRAALGQAGERHAVHAGRARRVPGLPDRQRQGPPRPVPRLRHDDVPGHPRRRAAGGHRGP